MVSLCSSASKLRVFYHYLSALKPGPPIPHDLTNLIPKKGTSKPEIVLFVGYPSTGKTTFFNQHFAPAGYIHVNQDILKSRGKCLKVVDEAIVAGDSAVVGTSYCSSFSLLAQIGLIARS